MSATPAAPLRPHPASVTASVDARRVEEVLGLIAPRWSAWALQTLAHHGPMRVTEAAKALPFISYQLMHQRLAKLQQTGLVTRDPASRAYQLTERGKALEPLQRALAAWSADHFATKGPMANAERVENAVRRLHLRHTTAVIQLLDDSDGLRFTQIGEATGLDDPYLYQRLGRLQLDGLVARVGPRRGDPYRLTEAGRALGPVYAAAQRWNGPAAPLRFTAPTPRGTHALGTEQVRSAATLRRTTAAPTALFSHATPQLPPASAPATAARGRGR